MSTISLAILTTALTGAHGMTPSVRPSRIDRMVFASARTMSTRLDSFDGGGILMISDPRNKCAKSLEERKGGKGEIVDDARSHRSRAMRSPRGKLLKAPKTPSSRSSRMP
jgi:hypothetical protein